MAKRNWAGDLTVLGITGLVSLVLGYGLALNQDNKIDTPSEPEQIIEQVQPLEGGLTFSQDYNCNVFGDTLYMFNVETNEIVGKIKDYDSPREKYYQIPEQPHKDLEGDRIVYSGIGYDRHMRKLLEKCEEVVKQNLPEE